MDQNASFVERAYQQIKTDILKCNISPGARLTEASLTEQYGQGRAAIRSALKMLAQEALVESLPRYGYVVAGYDELDPTDLFQIQMLLEPEAARLAAGRVDAATLKAADDECSRKSDIKNFNDACEWLHANTRFHGLIASFTGNALLSRFVVMLFERLERQLFASHFLEKIAREAAHCHPSLVDALIAGDAALAERMAKEQLGQTQQLILKYFKKPEAR